MSRIGNDSFLKRLPEEDRLAIEKGRSNPSRPQTQPTPQRAVVDIESKPPPSHRDAARFGPEDADVVYQSMVVKYHQEQADSAQQALSELAPQYDDFTALPPVVARLEYDSAVADFKNDPDVQQLQNLASYQTPATVAEPSPGSDAPPETAQSAVQAIHTLPLPETYQGGYYYDTGYPARVETFNNQRAGMAQQALDELTPSRADFAALPNGVAQLEYNTALADFNNDPYVAELHRIVDEAGANPSSLPRYLIINQPATTESISAPLTNDEVRIALQAVGIDIPENAEPELLSAGREVLDGLPGDLLAVAINPGMRVNFEANVLGVGTPSLLPAGLSRQLTIEGEVFLGNVQTGENFVQTQRFNATVETRLEGEVRLGSASRGLGNRIYGHIGPLGGLDLSHLSPLARGLVRGSDWGAKGFTTPVSGSYTIFGGAELSYEAFVSPEQGNRVADGDLAALPNPLDPINMEEGTGVVIQGGALHGSAFELSAKIRGPLRGYAEGSTTQLDGYAFSVKRLEGSLVEVQVGPVAGVEHDLYVGLGLNTKGISFGNVGIGSRENYSLQEDVRIARIDLSTTEGQAAYQQFISSGAVPNWNPPGVTAAGTTSVYGSESRFGLQGNVGGASVNFELGSHDFEARQTRWQDGSTSYQSQYVSNNDHTATVSGGVDALGLPVDNQWSVVVANHDDGLSSYLTDAFESDYFSTTQLDQAHDVQLKFSDNELLELRGMAREYYEQVRPEMLESIDALAPNVSDGLIANLAAASTAEDVYQVISDDLFAPDLGQQLLSLKLETGQPIPGQLLTQSSD